MVLKSFVAELNWRIPLGIALLALCLLQGCSTGYIKGSTSSKPSLIPATLPALEPPRPEGSSPKSSEDKARDERAESAPVPLEGRAASEVDVIQSGGSKSFEPQSAPSNLIAVLLEKSEKAIAMQQWLRAQRSLEQALRVDPENPLIYQKYAEVYKGMGLDKEAEQMLKRVEQLLGN